MQYNGSECAKSREARRASSKIESRDKVSSVRVFFDMIYLGFVGDFMNNLPQIIVILVLTLATFVSFLAFAVYYARTHELPKAALVVLRYWHGTLFNILLIPIGLFFAMSVGRVGEQFTALNTFFMVCAVLCLGYAVAHVHYITILLNFGPYLSARHFHCWRPKMYYLMVLLMMVPGALAAWSKNFMKIYQLLPKICYIALSPFVIKQFAYCNFMFTFVNALWTAVIIGGDIGALLCIVKVASGLVLSVSLYHSISLVCTVVLLVVFWIVYHHRVKTIRNRLNYGTNDVTEEEKRELLKKLNITSEDGAIMHLTLGLEYGCEMFVDWTLQSYLIREFQNRSAIIVYLAWFTAFFPAEHQKLQSQVTMAAKLRNIPVDIASLFSQIRRVYVFRQSATSPEVNTDLKKVRALTEQLITLYTNFWRDILNPGVDLTISRYNCMTKVRLMADSLWGEMLEKYPNNPRFAKEYSRYLLEARCDFKRANQWHKIATALEDGQRLIDDKLFQRFRATFPFYIKQKIVGPAGQLCPRMGAKVYETYSSDSARDSSEGSASGSPVENRETETTNRDIVPQIEQRLSLQRALKKYRSRNITRIRLWVCFGAFMTTLYCCLAFGLITTLFSSRDRLLYVVDRFATLEEYLTILTPQIPWWWAMFHSEDLQVTPEIIDKVGSSVYLIDTYVQLSTSLQTIIEQFAFGGTSALNEMCYDLYKEPLEDGSLVQQFSQYMSNYSTENIVVCQGQGPAVIVAHRNNSATPDYIIRDFLNTAVVLTLDSELSDRKSWYDSVICGSFLLRHWDVIDTISLAVSALSPFYEEQYAIYRETGTSKYLFKPNESMPYSFKESYSEAISGADAVPIDTIPLIIVALTPFIVFLFVFCPVVYLSVGSELEVEKLTSLLKHFPASEVEKAAKRASNPDAFAREEENEETVLQNQATFRPVWIPSFLFASFIILVIVIMAQSAMSSGRQMDHSIQHFILTIELQNLLTGLASDAIFSVFIRMMKEDLFNQPTVDSFGNELSDRPLWISVSDITAHMDEEINRTKIVYNMLSYGSESVPPLSHNSGSINRLFFDSLCTYEQGSGFASDYYRCISFDILVNYVLERVMEVRTAPERFFMNSSDILDMGFLIDSRLATGFASLFDEYVNLYEKERGMFATSALWLCFIPAVIACLISFIILDCCSVWRIECINQTFKDVLLRIDPVAFVHNEKAMMYLLNKTSQLDTRIISGSHAMFELSSDAVVIISQNGVIESLNPAVTKLFGYPPEQILGQNIEILLSIDSHHEHVVLDMLEAMRSGASELKRVCELNGRKDDGTEIPLTATVLGFIGSGKIVNSFAVVWKDNTTSEETKRAMEEVEAELHELYLHVLPLEIVEKIRSKASSTSLQVPCATVAFLGIDNFLPYAETLSPMQLMKNLSTIFSYYDGFVDKYPLLSKIRVVGDIYIVAGGIFSIVPDHAFHATQAVNFCLDCLEVFDDVNIEINSNLFMRIGIQTGGPITSGLVGDLHYPSFEIIGEPVATAEKLQRTGEPKAIHICEDMLSYIPTQQLVIAQGTEIELSDGTKSTYLISARMEKNRARIKMSITGYHPLAQGLGDRKRHKRRKVGEDSQFRPSKSLPDFPLLGSDFSGQSQSESREQDSSDLSQAQYRKLEDGPTKSLSFHGSPRSSPMRQTVSNLMVIIEKDETESMERTGTTKPKDVAEPLVKNSTRDADKPAPQLGEAPPVKKQVQDQQGAVDKSPTKLRSETVITDQTDKAEKLAIPTPQATSQVRRTPRSRSHQRIERKDRCTSNDGQEATTPRSPESLEVRKAGDEETNRNTNTTAEMSSQVPQGKVQKGPQEKEELSLAQLLSDPWSKSQDVDKKDANVASDDKESQRRNDKAQTVGEKVHEQPPQEHRETEAGKLEQPLTRKQNLPQIEGLVPNSATSPGTDGKVQSSRAEAASQTGRRGEPRARKSSPRKKQEQAALNPKENPQTNETGDSKHSSRNVERPVQSGVLDKQPCSSPEASHVSSPAPKTRSTESSRPPQKNESPASRSKPSEPESAMSLSALVSAPPPASMIIDPESPKSPAKSQSPTAKPSDISSPAPKARPGELSPSRPSQKNESQASRSKPSEPESAMSLSALVSAPPPASMIIDPEAPKSPAKSQGPGTRMVESPGGEAVSSELGQSQSESLGPLSQQNNAAAVEEPAHNGPRQMPLMDSPQKIQSAVARDPAQQTHPTSPTSATSEKPIRLSEELRGRPMIRNGPGHQGNKDDLIDVNPLNAQPSGDQPKQTVPGRENRERAPLVRFAPAQDPPRSTSPPNGVTSVLSAGSTESDSDTESEGEVAITKSMVFSNSQRKGLGLESWHQEQQHRIRADDSKAEFSIPSEEDTDSRSTSGAGARRPRSANIRSSGSLNDALSGGFQGDPTTKS